jgi:carboxyl-terminal processing protease
MRRWPRKLLLALSALVVAFVLLGPLAVRGLDQDGFYSQLRLFTDVMGKVRKNYVEEVETSQLLRGALFGLTDGLDPFSGYLNEEQLTAYRELRDHQRADVGLEVAKRGLDYGYVVAVREGGPAWKAGVRSGMMLRAIDGISTFDQPLFEIEKRLTGAEASQANLSIQQPSERDARTVTVTRELWHGPMVLLQRPQPDAVVVRLLALEPGAAQEIAAALEPLALSGDTALLLDLRDLESSDLQEAARVADLFLHDGTVATVSTRGGQAEPLRAESDQIRSESLTRLAVLVNQGTAGASEAIAAALKNLGGAKLLGSPTFGKRSLQTLVPLDQGAALLISTARFQASGDSPAVLQSRHRVEDDSEAAESPEGEESDRIEPDQLRLKPDLEIPLEDESAAAYLQQRSAALEKLLAGAASAAS